MEKQTMTIQVKNRGKKAVENPTQGWSDSSLEQVVNECELAKSVMDEMGQDSEYFKKENVEYLLTTGEVIYTPLLLFRAVVGTEVCPLCGATFEDGMGALSRKDNETVICNTCGTNEAMEEFTTVKK